MPKDSQSERDERLGSLAVRKGIVTPVELHAALQTQKEQMEAGRYRPLGSILVELGHLSEESLDKLLHDQAGSWAGQRVVGRYRLLEKIGEGGMGSVWKAVHVDLGNTVAIKLLPFSVVGDKRLVTRFQREARLLASINHTNIVQAFDAGEDTGQPFFVMPHLDGASVAQILRRCGRMGVRTALSVALQVIRGLNYAHTKGMVHRDLKPENLFITNDGTVKILDLGLAKLLEGQESSGSASTKQGVIVGTPQYMSPEQIIGDPNIDARSDLYSLGATIYVMVTGLLPFPGKHLPEVLNRKIKEDPPDPREGAPDLPDPVRNVVLRMMARDPALRPQDGIVLEAEFEALLEGRPVTGTLLSPGSIAMGMSERDTRTFNLTDAQTGLKNKGQTVLRPRRHREVDSSATTVIPRPPSTKAAEQVQRGITTREMPQSGVEMKTTRLEPPPEPKLPEPPPAPEPPRVQVGWLGQVIAATILVIVTIVITLAIVRMKDRGAMPPPAKTERP